MDSQNLRLGHQAEGLGHGAVPLEVAETKSTDVIHRPRVLPPIHCVHTGPVLKSSLGLAPNPGPRQSIKISTLVMPSFQDQRGVPSGS